MQTIKKPFTRNDDLLKIIEKIAFDNGLDKEDWVEYSKPYCETYWPKFNIWFWSPPIPKNNTKKDSGGL